MVDTITAKKVLSTQSRYEKCEVWIYLMKKVSTVYCLNYPPATVGGEIMI